MASFRPRDVGLIDALDGQSGLALDETVWRVAREGREPTDCGSAGGRWDDTTFDVLYTSRSQDGALAEMAFHLRRGQPIIPSRIRFSLHELNLRLENALDLSDRVQLEQLGLDLASYGQMSYSERTAEYPRTQEIAEVAHFHGYDGIIVPSARSGATNIIVFCDRVDIDQMTVLKEHGSIDWRKVPTL